MTATITIKMDNAAFDGGPEIELARILKEMAQKLQDHGLTDEMTMRDINGNKVGELEITGADQYEN